MIYTQQLLKAIKFAAKTHNHYQEQRRKGKRIPYISHPLTAGVILAKAGVPEDVVVAGILHDTIEDSAEHKKVTPEMLGERFGERVKDLVVSVTEMDKRLSWAERKAEALAHIEHFSHGSVLVKSADVLSNGTELVDDYWSAVRTGKDGMAVFRHFRASAEETLANYERVIMALIARWPKSPLTADLKNLAKEIKKLKELKEMRTEKGRSLFGFFLKK